MKRPDGRLANELRQIQITPSVSEYAEGSALIQFGRTRVLCTASYEAQVPPWLKGTGQGWVTAEYGMLPRSTHTRMKREKIATAGRSQEISRLIGRSLRAAVDLKKMGEKQITVDCDVIVADGGTRTAAITGGFVALALAIQKLRAVSELRENPLVQYISAISVGLQGDSPLVDLNYDEDSTAGTDMNFVMTDGGKFIELQGTAEHHPFGHSELNAMIALADQACRQLFLKQAEIVGSILPLQKAP